jgi:hypothetical protein
MYSYIIGAIVGSALMSRTKPRTQMRQIHMMGPRSGIVWLAEFMPGGDVVVLHAPAPDNTIALFQKGAEQRFKLLRGLRGHEATITLMQKDLEP